MWSQKMVDDLPAFAPPLLSTSSHPPTHSTSPFVVERFCSECRLPKGLDHFKSDRWVTAYIISCLGCRQNRYCMHVKQKFYCLACKGGGMCLAHGERKYNCPGCKGMIKCSSCSHYYSQGWFISVAGKVTKTCKSCRTFKS